MANKIEVEKINYFPELAQENKDYNGKVLYRRNGKLNLAHIHICFFHKEIRIAKNQPKECKVYVGLHKALNDQDYFKL